MPSHTDSDGYSKGEGKGIRRALGREALDHEKNHDPEGWVFMECETE